MHCISITGGIIDATSFHGSAITTETVPQATLIDFAGWHGVNPTIGANRRKPTSNCDAPMGPSEISEGHRAVASLHLSFRREQ